RARGGDEAAAARARWLAATNPTLLVFGQSGMEPALAALAVAAGAWALTRPRWGLAVGLVVLAIGAGLRPEVHLVLALAGVAAIARVARSRRSAAPAA